MHPGAIALKYCTYIKIADLDAEGKATGKYKNYLLYSTSSDNAEKAGQQYKDLCDFMYNHPYSGASQTFAAEEDMHKMIGVVTGSAPANAIGKVMKMFNMIDAHSGEFEFRYLNKIGTVITMTPEDVKSYMEDVETDYDRARTYFKGAGVNADGRLLITEKDLDALEAEHFNLGRKWWENGIFNCEFSDKNGAHVLYYHSETKDYKKVDVDTEDKSIEENLSAQGYVQLFEITPLDEKRSQNKFSTTQWSGHFLEQVQNAEMGLDSIFKNVDHPAAGRSI